MTSFPQLYGNLSNSPLTAATLSIASLGLALRTLSPNPMVRAVADRVVFASLATAAIVTVPQRVWDILSTGSLGESASAIGGSALIGTGFAMIAPPEVRAFIRGLFPTQAPAPAGEYGGIRDLNQEELQQLLPYAQYVVEFMGKSETARALQLSVAPEGGFTVSLGEDPTDSVSAQDPQWPSGQVYSLLENGIKSKLCVASPGGQPGLEIHHYVMDFHFEGNRIVPTFETLKPSLGFSTAIARLQREYPNLENPQGDRLHHEGLPQQARDHPIGQVNREEAETFV